jgi:hypothetical protein
VGPDTNSIASKKDLIHRRKVGPDTKEEKCARKGEEEREPSLPIR